MVVWQELDRLARRSERKFRQAFMSAVAGMKARVDLAELANQIATNRPAAKLPVIEDKDFGAVGRAAEELFRAAAQLVVQRTTFKHVRKAGEMVARLDMVNQRTVDFLRRYKFELVSGLTADSRTALRTTITRAFESGGHPYQQAREIRDAIGLTQRQANAVFNYRDALEAEDRTDEQIDRMVERYADRQLTQRAETIARTETIRASAAGQQEVWRQAVEEGFLLPSQTKRVWVVTPDDRLCEICSAIPELNPDGVGLEETFETELGPVLSPPVHPNCRCAVSLEIAT